MPKPNIQPLTVPSSLWRDPPSEGNYRNFSRVVSSPSSGPRRGTRHPCSTREVVAGKLAQTPCRRMDPARFDFRNPFTIHGTPHIHIKQVRKGEANGQAERSPTAHPPGCKKFNTEEKAEAVEQRWNCGTLNPRSRPGRPRGGTDIWVELTSGQNNRARTSQDPATGGGMNHATVCPAGQSPLLPKSTEAPFSRRRVGVPASRSRPGARRIPVRFKGRGRRHPRNSAGPKCVDLIYLDPPFNGPTRTPPGSRNLQGILDSSATYPPQPLAAGRERELSFAASPRRSAARLGSRPPGRSTHSTIRRHPPSH